MKNKICLSLFLICLVKLASATLSASVDRQTISLGQSFTLTLTLNDNGAIPNLDPLQQNFVVYGTSTTSQTNIINGHSSSQNTDIISLAPKNPGKQVIPALKVGNDTTNPITIDVLHATAATPALKDSEVYLTASIAKQDVYVGTPILYSIKLYYTVAIANVIMGSLSVPDAQVQALGKSIQYQSTENGNNYQVIEQKFLITPAKPGILNIPPAKISGIITQGSNSFFAPPQSFSVSSKAQTLHIKPIPTGIAPGEWLPAQQLSLSESWSINTPQLKLGQPLTRTIVIQTSGIPATSIPDLDIATPTGINAYPDKPTSTVADDGNTLIAHKTFKIGYIPTQAGTITFPAVKLKWWDIGSNSLKTTVIPAKSYTVAADTTPAGIPIKSVQLSPSSTPPNPSRWIPSLWFYLAVFFAALWLVTIATLCWRKKSTRIKITKPEAAFPLPNSEKSALASIAKACHNQNIQALNVALINFASLHWQTNIYTVSDIADLINEQNFSSLIERFNLALYRGQEFTEFKQLQRRIVALSTTQKHTEVLQEFYPK
jgi:hypothetical protein